MIGLMENILKAVKAEEMHIIQMRRDLHRIPELQLCLPKTVRYVCGVLDSLKIPYDITVNGNAVAARIDGYAPGKCIAVRADMDGLPIKENTGLSFASEHEGCMHACGHDGHTAIALGLCAVLKKIRDSFKGSVKVLFQPGEEYPGGALPMIEEGALKNPAVSAVIGLHAGCLFPALAKGKIGVSYGTMFASMDRFALYIRGKGAHAALPHLSADPIPAACEIVSALQKIISREIAPTSNALISVCQIHAGTSQNIIPDEVFLEGTVRTTSETVRSFIAQRVKEIAEGIAKAHRAECETVYDFKYPVLTNDREFTKFFVTNTKELLGEDSVEEITVPTMGGEDMAYFLQKVPGTFFMLSNPVVRPDGMVYPHHTDKFDIDEALLYKGAAAILATVLAYLKN